MSCFTTLLIFFVPFLNWHWCVPFSVPLPLAFLSINCRWSQVWFITYYSNLVISIPNYTYILPLSIGHLCHRLPPTVFEMSAKGVRPPLLFIWSIAISDRDVQSWGKRTIQAKKMKYELGNSNSMGVKKTPRLYTETLELSVRLISSDHLKSRNYCDVYWIF